MGLRFLIEHTNLVAYLSSAERPTPPRARAHDVKDFLRRLSAVGGKDYQFSFKKADRGFDRSVITDDKLWLEQLHAAARRALLTTALFDPLRLRDEFSSSEVGIILSPLRKFFTGYALYALVISGRDAQAAHNFFNEAAASSGAYGLFLLPDWSNELVNILSPFPALQALAEMPTKPPVVIFWSEYGGVCVLPLQEAASFYFRELAPRIRDDPRSVDSVLKIQASQRKARSILHISDLHFGQAGSARIRRLLKAHLKPMFGRFDRVVVTGDLADQPEAELLDEYLEFRADVEDVTRKRIIAIPGNHDVRPNGNSLGSRPTYEIVKDFGWEPLVVDDELGCTFFCFNSMEAGLFARGFVSDEQRTRMASAFLEECNKRRKTGAPDCEAYLKVALVHHHPYSYVTKSNKWWDKALRFITRDEDTFVRFEDSERFVSWCVDRGVSLILHGHKHVPNHIEVAESGTGEHKRMLVIACGSTTGAEGTPLRYDVISLDPMTKAWGVTFFQDTSRSGASFSLEEVTVDPR